MDERLELSELSRKYQEWMQVKNFTQDTIKANRERLGYFIAWCQDIGISLANEVTRETLERYQTYLAHAPNKKNGKPLSGNTKSIYGTCVCRFFRWLAKQNTILSNPADGIRVPQAGQTLPRNVLTHREAEAVISQPDIRKERGIRDRAILETLYSTGIRASELVRLNIRDLDLEQGMVKVLEGKGRKDRLIPIGERAVLWLEKYMREVRFLHVLGKNESALFLTVYGKPFSRKGFSRYIGKYVKAANIGKEGGCHLFRHAMATGMLEGGADIRYIQEMLGHASINTTQIYTKVSIKKLKQIHKITHPREKENSHEPQNP